jgi:hypothetical protein
LTQWTKAGKDQIINTKGLGQVLVETGPGGDQFVERHNSIAILGRHHIVTKEGLCGPLLRVSKREEVW